MLSSLKQQLAFMRCLLHAPNRLHTFNMLHSYLAFQGTEATELAHCYQGRSRASPSKTPRQGTRAQQVSVSSPDPFLQHFPVPRACVMSVTCTERWWSR